MFGETVSCDLVIGADGVPTGVASAKKEAVLAGVFKAITSKFSDKTVVKGIGATIADAGAIYAAMALTRKKLVGNFALNPLAV